MNFNTVIVLAKGGFNGTSETPPKSAPAGAYNETAEPDDNAHGDYTQLIQ